MSSGYTELLNATIRHLEDLKSHGGRFVAVAPSTVQALTKPAPRLIAPAVPVTRKPLSPAPAQPLPKAASIESARPILRSTDVATTVFQPAVSTAVALSREEKELAMAELREKVLACVKCPNLVVARRNVVFGVGDIHSPLMFVGEAPGADEDLQGEPFVGAAGQLLTRIIQTMGLSRQTVYIANILKCRPDTPGQSAGNRKPTSAEMQTCSPYLLAQIGLIQPRVIVALGATAVEGMLANKTGIMKLRGRWQEFRGVPVMPTFHPAYLLRNQALTEKRKVWEDMLAVMERLALPISEKQRGYFLKAAG